MPEIDSPKGAVDEARFIENMQRLREAEGLSQGELARRMTDEGFTGFHQTTISRIEKGERPLRLSEARGLADIFGKTMAQMVSPPADEQAIADLYEAIGEMTDAERALRAAVDQHEGASAVGKWTLIDVEERLNAEAREGTHYSGQYLTLISHLKEKTSRLADSVVNAYLEELHGDPDQEEYPEDAVSRTPASKPRKVSNRSATTGKFSSGMSKSGRFVKKVSRGVDQETS